VTKRSGAGPGHGPRPVVRLRRVEDDDLPIFLAHQDDPVAAAMAAFPTRAPDAFYAHWATIRADPTNVTRTIVADGQVVGDIVSWLEKGEREVGYWIGREQWGRGVATAALRLLLEEIPDRPITAHVALDNIGARRVLEHCGFVAVGEADADDGVRETIMRLG
jgi:RimJ/RimL family protein N-acetyltransferase